MVLWKSLDWFSRRLRVSWEPNLLRCSGVRETQMDYIGKGQQGGQTGREGVGYVGIVDAMSTVMMCDRRDQVTRIVGKKEVVVSEVALI